MVIEKTFKIYQFKELSETVQKDLLEQFRHKQNNNDYLLNDCEMYLEDDLKNLLDELLKENNIENVNSDKTKLFYSLSHSQGDGVCFEGVYTYENKSFKVTQSGKYYHYNSKDIQVYDALNELNLSYEDEKNLISGFNKVYISICRQLEKKGYKWLSDERDYLTSEEYAREMLEENNYLENGTEFNY